MSEPITVPVLFVADQVVLPGMVVPIALDDAARAAVEAARATDSGKLLIAPRLGDRYFQSRLKSDMIYSGTNFAIGFALALPLPKVFAAMFFDLHLGEPRIYLVVPGAIFLVALLATYIPARRATRVDPMSALRQE